jgi:hypothetical protein
MRFSSLFSLTVLAGLVLASPIEERGTGISPVESAVEPQFEVATAQIHSTAAAHIEGGSSTGVKPGVSKRSEYNELEGRGATYFIACTGLGCTGTCYAYTLPVTPYVCYSTITYASAFVSASGGLSYGVYAALNCNGSFGFYSAFRTYYLS